MLLYCGHVWNFHSFRQRYISKYRVFEIRIVAGLFVTRLVADDTWRFYNRSQPIRDINFDSCRVPRLGALGACDLCSYKQYFDGRTFRPESYRGHLFSRASDLLLILLLLYHRRCKELYIISWFFHLCSTIPYYFIRLRKLCEEIADALRIYCKTKLRFREYFEYLSMEWKSEKSTIWTMIYKGINKVKWLSWQKNFNESNKIFFFFSPNSFIFLTNI